VVISDAAIHELEVTAEGYQPLRQRLTFDRDVILRLHLQPRRRSSGAISATAVRGRDRDRDRPAVVPAEPRPVAAVTPVAPVSAPVPEARPEAGKRTIDSSPFEDGRPKRQLDSDVFEPPSKPKASSIDRENPWP
jgi:hypothetical protein